MKVKLSSYVSQFLVDHGITHAFTVTGGGAMHLNDSLGHQEGLTCVYIIMNRHVQLRQKAMQEFIIRLQHFVLQRDRAVQMQ